MTGTRAQYTRAGIHWQLGPGTYQPELVSDFQNFVGPSLVRSRDFSFFDPRTGPDRLVLILRSLHQRTNVGRINFKLLCLAFMDTRFRKNWSRESFDCVEKPSKGIVGYAAYHMPNELLGVVYSWTKKTRSTRGIFRWFKKSSEVACFTSGMFHFKVICIRF